MGYDSWAKSIVAQVAASHSLVPEVAAQQLASSIGKLGAQKLTEGQRKQLATTLLDSLAEGEGKGAK